MVDLVDSEGRRVHGQEVPLKVSLLYEDLQDVGKQDILKLSSDTRQLIDETGTATLRLRIEDVSKNHQSKGFVVRVAPDTQHSPLNSDISPDVSTSVSVRSKRNRRSKHAGGSRVEDDVSLVGHALSRSSMDLALPISQSMLQDSQLPSIGADGKFDIVGGAGGGVAGGTPMIKALSNVIAWTRTVVNGLYQIQWQLIGYESKPDGSPDINKPLFNIHNPNTIVTNILQSYRAETMDQLRYLVQALESGDGGGAGGPPNGSMMGSGAGYPGGAYGPGGGGMPRDASGASSAMGSRGMSMDEREPPPLATAFGGGAYSTGATGSAMTNHSMDAMGNGMGGGGSSAMMGGGGPGGEATGGNDASSMPPPTLPPMMRGRSAMTDGGYDMGLLPLVRESTYDLLAGMDPSWFGMDPSEPSPNAIIETQVHYIVASEYYSDSYDTLGFPAFDSKQQLVSEVSESPLLLKREVSLLRSFLLYIHAAWILQGRKK